MTNPTAYDPHPHLDPRPPKVRRWWTTPLIVVVSVLAGIGIGATGASSDQQPVTSEALAEWERQLDEREDALDAEQDTPAVVEEEPELEPVSSFDTPTADDFTLTVRTMEQECFGSAGCLVTFQIDAGWLLNLDPSITYEVTYEIEGADDPYINTIRVEGEEYWTDESETIGTPSSESNLTVHVLEVREQ